MKVLILLEEEKYLPVAKQIKNNCTADVEISNIDFNLTKSIMESQVLILLGGQEPYTYLKTEYAQLLEEKLLFTTFESSQKLNLEINMKIMCGVVICQIPKLSYELSQVISEVCHLIFDDVLKVLEATDDTYSEYIHIITGIIDSLQLLIDNNENKLPTYIIEQVFHQFKSSK